DRSGGLRQRFDIGDAIDSRAGPLVEANVFLPREQGPKIGDGMLSGHLIGADFQDRLGQVKRFGRRPNHPVEELVHGVRLKLMLFSWPAFTSQARSESSGSRYLSGTKERGTAEPFR